MTHCEPVWASIFRRNIGTFYSASVTKQLVWFSWIIKKQRDRDMDELRKYHFGSMYGLKFGLILGGQPPKARATDIVEQGIQAEKDGYDYAWICDHLLDIGPPEEPWNPDPWATFGYLAAETRRIRFCTSVTAYQKTHPGKLTQILATLDELSRGRITLGISTGEAMNNVPFGVPWEKASLRVEQLGEYIEVIRLLWTVRNTSPASFQGKHYSLQDAWVDITRAAQQPHLPIYIGAFASPRLLELIGRVGDGWFPVFITPELYQEKLKIIHAAAKKAGRQPDTVEATHYVTPVVSRDSKTIEEATRNLKISIASICPFLCRAEGIKLPSSAHQLNYQKMTSSEIISKDAMEDLSRMAEYIPDSLVSKVAPIGDADYVISWLEARKRLGAKHMVIGPGFGLPEENLRALSEQILPYFRDQEADSVHFGGSEYA